MEIISSAICKSRKEHRCNYCNGMIAVGEKYESTTITGNSIYLWKAHLRCRDIAIKLKMFDGYEDGVSRDDFIEYVHSEYIDLEGREKLPYSEFQERLKFVCKHHNIK